MPKTMLWLDHGGRLIGEDNAQGEGADEARGNGFIT